VEPDTLGRLEPPSLPREQDVEGAVQRHERGERRDGRAQSPTEQRAGRDQRGDGAQPVPPTEVERRRCRPVAEQQADPRHASIPEVALDHAPQAPGLQVRALQVGVELDPVSGRGQPRTEVDVLHGRHRVAIGVEAARGVEAVAANGAQPRPERRRRPRALLVDVVVEQVAKSRDGAGVGGPVVVGAEQPGQRGVGIERPPDAPEGVAVHDHVGVHEHDHVAGRTDGAAIPCLRRAAASLVDDDQLVGRLVRAPDRVETAVERRRRVRGRHDRAQSHSQDDALSSGCDGRAQGKDAGSARIRRIRVRLRTPPGAGQRGRTTPVSS